MSQFGPISKKTPATIADYQAQKSRLVSG
jgi:hypothetical protein